MIKIEHMSKNYGPYPAVIDISFEVLKGEIIGFLGPNGAGKTTTMRVVTGFTPPSDGEVTVGGYNVVSHSLEVTVPLYLDMTVTDYLRYMGEIRGMSSKWVKERLPKIIEMVRLGEYRNTLVGRLSKGYRQRTGIAQAILHDPEVLIMDEPTIGIDPIQVVETRELISDLGQEHTMLLSSHILPEVSAICKRVLVINDGRIVADDKPESLSDKLQTFERIELSITNDDNNDFISKMRDIPIVIDARSDQRASKIQRSQRENSVPYIVDAKPNSKASEIISKTIIENSWGLTNLTPLPMTLEEIFLELTTEEELGD